MSISLKNLLKDLKHFELEHKIIFFTVIMFLTIVAIRINVLIKNSNIPFFGIELHHFDYGLVLILITTLFLLFGKKRPALYLFLSAIGFGLLIDNLWFIRSLVSDPLHHEEILIYNSTIPVVALFLAIVIGIIFLINKLKKSKDYKKSNN